MTVGSSFGPLVFVLNIILYTFTCCGLIVKGPLALLQPSCWGLLVSAQAGMKGRKQAILTETLNNSDQVFKEKHPPVSLSSHLLTACSPGDYLFLSLSVLPLFASVVLVIKDFFGSSQQEVQL